MNIEVTPASIAPPAAAYAHAVVSKGTTKMLHTAGGVPIAPAGKVPEGLADQARVVWANIQAILDEASFAITDIVAMTTYVVSGANLNLVMGARDEVLGGHRAASTLVFVPALARPQWLMEVAVVAAQ